MSVSKGLGFNLRVQYQNVGLTCERIRLTFGIFFSSLFFSWFLHFKKTFAMHNG
jgi:hypothetical protein